MSKKTILVCPTPGCTCGTFTVTAHVTETWEVTREAEFMDTVDTVDTVDTGDEDVTHRPSIGEGDLLRIRSRSQDPGDRRMKLPPDFDKVCAEATRVWGVEAQEAVAIGEIGELLTMFGRRARKRDTPEQWVDEIADVLMMASQLAVIHGKGAVEARLQIKIEKLRTCLAKYGAVLPEPNGRADPEARLATADDLLQRLLPIVQCANDG